MTIRCKGDGAETFGPHMPELASMIHEAIAEVFEKYGADFHELEAWTKASIIRDKIVSRLKLYCDERPGLHPIRKNNASYFGVDSKYLVKVKRFGQGFRVNLPSTASATLFDKQESPLTQGELIEGADVTNVYVGYVPTENAPLEPPVYIVCKDKKGRVFWAIECKPPEPPPAIELHPSSPGDDVPSPVRVRVKKRKSGTND